MLRRAFEALVPVLNERGIRYAIIGGIAAVQHVRIRATDDIDVLLAVPQVGLPGLFEALGEQGFDVNLRQNVHEFTNEGLTSIAFGGVTVDLMRPVIPVCSHVLDRSIEADVFGHRVRICSAEGLILLKLMAMRPQDEADILEVLSGYGDRVDVGFICAELESFTEPGDFRRERFLALLRQAESIQ
jgi:predicted nucleotidyltransferase